MTEAEWLACTNPNPLLEFLKGKASERKLRLFACSCARRVWTLLADARSQAAVEASERYADGLCGKDELYDARNAAKEVVFHCPRGVDRGAAQVAVRAAMRDGDGPSDKIVWYTASEACGMALQSAVSLAYGEVYGEARQPGLAAEHQWQATIIRDIMGNPFRRVAVNTAWLTWNDAAVRRIAHVIYHDRDFDHLYILADALEEAGCDNTDILAHCRGPGLHVRGCWVVDLILGKE